MDDSDEELDTSKNKANRFDLIRYNKGRKQKLRDFDYSMDMTKDETLDLEEEVNRAT